jgi:hypothetical protein
VLDSRFWFFQVRKNPVDVCHDMPVGSKQAMITINICGTFIQVAGADEPIMNGMVAFSFPDQAYFGCAFWLGIQQYFYLPR